LAEEVDADDNTLPDVVDMISETEVAGKKIISRAQHSAKKLFHVTRWTLAKSYRQCWDRAGKHILFPIDLLEMLLLTF